MKLTQCEKIVEYMNEHGSITQLDAYKLGCMRLPSRIHDLRKQGYAINVKTERVKKADGGYAPIARYSLCNDTEIINEKE